MESAAGSCLLLAGAVVLPFPHHDYVNPHQQADRFRGADDRLKGASIAHLQATGGGDGIVSKMALNSGFEEVSYTCCGLFACVLCALLLLLSPLLLLALPSVKNGREGAVAVAIAFAVGVVVVIVVVVVLLLLLVVVVVVVVVVVLVVVVVVLWKALGAVYIYVMISFFFHYIL